MDRFSCLNSMSFYKKNREIFVGGYFEVKSKKFKGVLQRISFEEKRKKENFLDEILIEEIPYVFSI